ncbi:uncharacterized protein LOC122515432 [Polistes fuscatus]|uniref:uncharacterized protein LOC122515432 n=1 Tax=Polistes fuscatus TaxID=30207 RepID=UPI001CA964EE|nr:uncharacterized protein LOC122515432 [Polistes fuscatus]
MKRIGWMVMCLFLLASFSNKVISDKRTDVIYGFNKIEERRNNKLTAVSNNSLVDRGFENVRHFFDEIFDGNVTEGKWIETGRTFGIKRLQFMLMPMMYKMGVMMTLLTVLTVISLKGLLIGIILLVLKLSSFFAKFYAGWNQQHVPHSWSPQPIHVHVHNDLPYAHGQAYHAWQTASGPENEEHYYYKG